VARIRLFYHRRRSSGRRIGIMLFRHGLGGLDGNALFGGFGFKV
jgi:hypothetical protein